MGGTQFYVHIPFEKGLLDAHKLLLSGLPSSVGEGGNRTLWAKSAVDLVKPREKTCECFRKLVFCGYNVYAQRGDAGERRGATGDAREDWHNASAPVHGTEGGAHRAMRALTPSRAEREANYKTNRTLRPRKRVGAFGRNASAPAPRSERGAHRARRNSSTSLRVEREVNYETNYTLWPGKHVDVFGRSVSEVSSCNPTNADFKQQPYHCRAYAELKTDLLSNIEAQYARHANLTAEIINHRRDILLKHERIGSYYIGDTSEWTIVGLAQRTSRRTWLNLANVLYACHARFWKVPFDRWDVVFVEVNVEDLEGPGEQLLVHRSLDALIGIHGAQLTQGLLLPPGSHILELLPWIPKYARGDWTQTTSIPTPVGVIFHNTDLNHLGYSLDRSSVPLCENRTREEEEGCFMSKENEWKFKWDNRNFVVDSKVVIRFVEDFVLPSQWWATGRDRRLGGCRRTTGRGGVTREEPCKCKDLLARSGDLFVPYNVWCKPCDGVAGVAVRHYYRDNVYLGQERECEDELKQSDFLKCEAPGSTPAWNYYNALVGANHKTAELAGSATEGPPGQENAEEEGRIPRRLIFTHKDNLFDCDISTQRPELFHLAENAKATVRAYRRVWPDVEHVFLTDGDCIDALNRTEPGLIPWFNSGLEGMYKADLCRAAYLFLHGGYYFDVDILVVRPYVAPNDATFVTVKGEKFPTEGFFQAFLAAEKGNPIVRRSLKMMLEALWQERTRGKYLGPTALMEAWMEAENVTNAWHVKGGRNGVHLLTEASLQESKSISRHGKIANVIASKDGMHLYQHVPAGHGENCQFSAGACNVVVISQPDETLYFYSRVLGTKWCGKRLMDDGECTDQGMLLERIRQAKEKSQLAT